VVRIKTPSAATTAAQKPIISNGRRKKQRLRANPNATARPYRPIAATATINTKIGGVNRQQSKPVVPILQAELDTITNPAKSGVFG
jgi:hypothetical protein